MIPYHTGRYGQKFSYRNLNRYRNTFVSYRLKYRSYWVISALPEQILYFGRKTYIGLEQKNQDFQIWKKEKEKKKKKGFAYRSNIPKAVTFWFSFPAAESTLLMVIPFRLAPFFFFSIRPYQMSLSSILFHLPFQIPLLVFSHFMCWVCWHKVNKTILSFFTFIILCV